MRIKNLSKHIKIVILLLLSFILINSCSFFYFSIYTVYIPFGLALGHTITGLIIVIVYIPSSLFLVSKFKKYISIRYLLLISFILFSVLLGQIIYELNKFNIITVNSDIDIHNYTEFKEDSKTFEIIKKDIIETYAYLESVFPKENITNKGKLCIVLHPSFLDYKKNKDNELSASAHFHPLNNTIYIPLDYWNQLFKHELVHYFTIQRLYYSFSEFFKYLIDETPLRIESLAHYFQPHSPTLSARPVDYYYSFMNRDTINQLNIDFQNPFDGIKLKKKDLRSKYIVHAMKWFLASDDPKKVVEYYYNERPVHSRTINIECKRDRKVESYLISYFKEKYQVETSDSLKVIQSNLDSIGNIEKRIFRTRDNLKDKELVKVYKKNMLSLYRIIFSGFISTEDLLEKKEALLSIYKKSISKEFYSQAAYSYFYLNEITYFLGEELTLELEKNVKEQFNMSYFEYFSELKEKKSRFSF
jgi:hypothetical protein